jgi:hypothetical protein
MAEAGHANADVRWATYEHVRVSEVYVQLAVRRIDRICPTVFGADPNILTELILLQRLSKHGRCYLRILLGSVDAHLRLFFVCVVLC